MLAEGPTVTGNCPALGEGDTLTLLHLDLVLPYLPLCLSPLQSERGTAQWPLCTKLSFTEDRGKAQRRRVTCLWP